ncbi:rhomboid-like protein [Streptomyces sp. RPT161]|uniref:rhomboid-like protein n=1 Tax=Streptomyces sp. RPT161 TaxID=3015993 RepID=UPI0022B85F6B|nr:rhomboid-like protein [Streptomyces sp. RPT161]
MRSSRSRLPWVTATYAGALGIGAYGVGRMAPARRERLLRAHSTNVDNLRAGRWHTLVTSAFLTEQTPGPAFAALLVGALGRAETAWGARRTAGVFALGHIGASLLVYGGLRSVGASPRTAGAVDVGPSYGLGAVVARHAASIRRPALRAAAVTGLLALGVRPLLRRAPGFVDVGHLAALVIGLAGGHPPAPAGIRGESAGPALAGTRAPR